MKKTFLAMCFLAASSALVAQNTSTTTGTTNNNTGTTNSTTTGTTMDQTGTTTNSTLSTTGNYQAYGAAPSNIQMYMNRDYPTATNVTWQHNNEYWRASYNNNGRFNHVYYNEAGDNFTVALPVTTTWVPDNIISQVANTFGTNIYDITALRNASGEQVYQVRLLDNGTLRQEWLDANGVRTSAYYTTGDMNNGMNNTNQNMNATGTNNGNTNWNQNSTNNQNGTMNNNSTMNNMNSTNSEMKIKTEGDETKIKIETEDEKIKIEKEGNETKTKIKKKKKSSNNEM